jgi:hypothetical protein
MKTIEREPKVLELVSHNLGTPVLKINFKQLFLESMFQLTDSCIVLNGQYWIIYVGGLKSGEWNSI